MDRNVIGYLVWCAVGGACFVTAVSIWRSKKAVSLRWKKLDGEVTDVKKYNHAVAKLYILYGAVFILAGLPLFLLKAPVPAWVGLLTAAAVAADTGALFALYGRIVKKYKKKYGDWRD